MTVARFRCDAATTTKITAKLNHFQTLYYFHIYTLWHTNILNKSTTQKKYTTHVFFHLLKGIVNFNVIFSLLPSWCCCCFWCFSLVVGRRKTLFSGYFSYSGQLLAMPISPIPIELAIQFRILWVLLLVIFIWWHFRSFVRFGHRLSDKVCCCCFCCYSYQIVWFIYRPTTALAAVRHVDSLISHFDCLFFVVARIQFISVDFSFYWD